MSDQSMTGEDYDSEPLGVDDLGADPIVALRKWVQHAWDNGEPQANSMCLATVDAAGAPSARTVLLKSIDTGLVFYTNYTSAKAADLAATGVAAANFTWLLLHRQVRASGVVAKITAAESDSHFAARPRGAQIAAVASDQSSPLATRSELEDAFAAIEAANSERPIKRPEHWGGYRLTPDRVEFWQGRRNRMHDRLEFTSSEDGWAVRRLAP